ncbi:MAG: phenylacetate--CoA ligase family protein [Verrucomicrobia bacterium]|nr:phenylacetate--CoA ligase family protein [Verrucomicrobiota bacterium]MDA1005909.1 phenylacetate--CoA ligase family protein [Verrucomicrobiota bacterium]
MNWNPQLIRTIPECAWPGFMGGDGAARLASLFQLEQSQWLDPETITARQLHQAAGVLRHAAQTIPFYRARFQEAGFDPHAPLTPAHWLHLPILSRADVQLAGPKLLSPSIPKQHGNINWTQTSGSTGQPVRVATTSLVNHFWCAFTLRDHQWSQRDFQGKLAVLRASPNPASPPQPTTSPSWGIATHGLYQTGPSVSLDISANVSDQVAWLKRENPDYLLTYPSNLLALTNHCLHHGITLPNLKDVRAVGEIVTPAMRENCKQAWGVPLIDTYSSQEFGYIALQCHEHGQMHIQSENVLVEILDADDQPCAPGQTGRLVITSLHNFATPLIRYEIGDHATVGPPCACGRGLPVLAEILGRTRNMLVFESGEQRWPNVGMLRFRDIAPVQQCQTIQKSHTQLHVRLVVETPLTHTQEEKLIALIQSSLGFPFEIELEYLPEIPRSKSGKYEVFLCEVS